ncbi:MAG: ABC transporter ATP-binding protein [Dissulfurispiraceae bacterium]
MSDTVIKVEKLSKRYRLRHEQTERYTALRDVLARGVGNFGRRMLSPFTDPTSPLAASREDFYALKDINFEIERGDRVGIIGRNGAGKSTLLKILSRITEPTTGKIGIKGRVASLLEVGTGFHPELTGRENIFLNGAILGMTKAEIKKKFDDIVDFAEIEKFLDTPVKHFSSGMYVRLAFAVAAHLEPEILIVDEVLAVGDVQFQKKCLGKMENVGKEGRTVILVSHNMGAVLSFCNRGIHLRDGSTRFIGEIEKCVNNYVADWAGSSGRVIDLSVKKRTSPMLSKGAMLKGIKMITDSDTPWHIAFGEHPTFEISVTVTKPLPTIELGIALYNNNFIEIASSLSSDSISPDNVQPGEYKIIAEFRNLLLMPGMYMLGLGLKSGLSDIVMEDYIQEAAYFEITPSEASAKFRAHTRRGALIPQVDYTFSSR